MFLDTKKAYESLDRMWCMEILRVYGLGNNLQRLLERFWEGHMVVSRGGGCYGRPSKTEWGVTQGNPMSPTILNIVVDEVVSSTLTEVC